VFDHRADFLHRARAGRRDLLTGFGLYLIRAVLNGRGDEVIDLADTNLFR
jgi:hypothetical protein